MRPKDFVGKEAIHNHYGRVMVNSAPPRSKAMVDITVIQRGKGWDEINQKYKRYFVGSSLQEDGNRSLMWAFTNNDEYGTKETVHIDTLTLVE